MITLTTSHLTHDRQISPDKNVNFPCTTAAFTLSPEPVGFVVSCQLARRLSLPMRFLSVGSHVCHPASFRPFLTESPLPSARTFGSIHHMRHPWFSYRGLSPHKFTPMPGVHQGAVHLTRKNGGLDSGRLLRIPLLIRRAGDHARWATQAWQSSHLDNM